MSIEPTNDPAETPLEQYVIQVTGELGEHWEAWFEGMIVEQPGNGTTAITGHVTDQAALHGLLQRIRDLGVPLVSVTRLNAGNLSTVAPALNQPNKEGHQQ